MAEAFWAELPLGLSMTLAKDPVAKGVFDGLSPEERRAFVEQTHAQENKQVYYMSMEFLVGTSLRNNLYNMGLLEPAGEILHDLGFSLESLCALEPDAGLGNGGLGRLAACFLDSAATHSLPLDGFDDIGIGVSDVAHRHSRDEVVVGLALGSIEKHSLGALDRNHHRRRRGLPHVGEKPSAKNFIVCHIQLFYNILRPFRQIGIAIPENFD